MNIASTLLWVLGILNCLGGVALGFPQIAKGKLMFSSLYIFILGVAACIAAYLLRKKHPSSGIFALVVSVLSFISPPFIGLIIGSIVIAIVAAKWKELNPKV